MAKPITLRTAIAKRENLGLLPAEGRPPFQVIDDEMLMQNRTGRMALTFKPG